MSHATDAAIGMMDGAYFTSRSEILTFLNTLLNLNLTKVEQTASGAVACQLTEYIFPGSIPMSRVNWGAKSSHEYVANYKLLQNAFSKHKVQRYVDVDKLIRGKYQDNLEFCQWLKAFFDQTAPMMRGGREGYDPVAVRAKGKGKGGGAVKKTSASRTGVSGRTATGARTGSTRPAVRSTVSATSSSSSRPGSASSASSRVSATSARGQKENKANASGRIPTNPRKTATTAAASAKYEEEIRTLKSENTTLKSKYNELERASAELEMNLQTVESERDFYFEKLRGIEVMLQVYKEKEEMAEGSGDVNKVMDSIFKVMYATMDDNVEVDDEGNVLGDITVESSIDKSALLSVKAQDELGDEQEEELLTDGLDKEGDDAVVSPEENVVANQYSDDSEEELLTSGLDDEVPINCVEEPIGKVESIDEGDFKECMPVVQDDGFSDDENLLSD